MRSVRVGLTLCVLLLAIPSWGKQGSQNAPTPQPASDPQAVAVVQAAITALGGATAISQAQSWTFRAHMQGPHANGDLQYLISIDGDSGKLHRPDRTLMAAPPIHSHFIPALAASILLKETRDSTFTLVYGGTSTLDSKPVTTILFTIEPDKLPVQFWYFDATNLPVFVDFRLPAQVGARISYPITVALSDYRVVSGVLYPFKIVSLLPGRSAQTVLVQSLVDSAAAPPNDFNGPAGDLQ